MKEKKSQAEMFGIAIVAVIVILGIFLFSSFSKNDDDTGANLDSQIAQTMVNSMMRLHVDCNSPNGIPLRDVIKQCAKGYSDMCNGDTCGYAEDILINTLTNTLEIDKKPYKLSVTYSDGSGDVLSEIRSADYKDSLERDSPGVFLIPNDPTIIVQLDICKK